MTLVKDDKLKELRKIRNELVQLRSERKKKQCDIPKVRDMLNINKTLLAAVMAEYTMEKQIQKEIEEIDIEAHERRLKLLKDINEERQKTNGKY